jgi:MFS transporter, NNP family, nitrate/nitrite transporter
MKLLPLFVFWCFWFFNFSTRTAFSPLLPLIEDSLSLSHGASGGLFTSYAVGYALSLLLAGKFVSIWGYKRVVVVGSVGMGLLLCCFQWAGSYLALHVVFLSLGFVAGMYMPAILSIITGTYDPKHWGKAIGIHDSAAGVSILSMPILITLGLHYLPWKMLLLFLGLGCLILPVFFWKVSIEPRHDRSEQGARYIDLLKRRTTWIMGLLWMVSAAANLGVYSILPLYLIKERGMEFGLANNLFGFSRVCGLPVAILSGFLTDRYGYRKMAKWSVVAAGLSTIVLALSSSLTQILIALTLQATLSLAFFPVGLAAISKLNPPHERSLALGIIAAIGVIFGTGGAPFLLGLIADRFSFQVGIFWLGVLTTLSVLSLGILRDDPALSPP